jgi:hypothetical protein
MPMLRSRDVLAEQQQLIRLALQADAPRTGSARAAAEFAAIVACLVDEPYPQLRTQLAAALATLPRRDQQLLRLRVGLGHKAYAVRAALDLGTRYAVDQRADALLARLAGMLWTDAGAPAGPTPMVAARLSAGR